ncbi:mannan endo-1,4-beta-mannosidase [Thermoflexales bacterium]|nr:mannan endo-1,4-beta-mannosidase [Thermoflexales bacterium]
MNRIYKVFALVLLILIALGLMQLSRPVQAQTATGFQISGRNLLDANGNNFVIRGISHAHTWYPSQISSFANIKATGANTVRVVLSGGRWTKNSASDVANVIELCKTNRLICVLENHDTTGYGEQSGAVTLDQAVSYWKEIQSVLTGQEAYVIINIGNEPYGNNNTSAWINATKNAIAAMRTAGFQHTLMVDAPNWGQDWQFVMRDNAVSIFDSDPNQNTILSIHMYGVFDTASEITSYLATFVNAGLPLVIGEFGNMHSDGNPDEDTIMAQAQANGIGYMGWSWSGNGGGVEYLDMVTNFDPNQVTSWGTRLIAGANGLQQTSQEASVYGGPTPTPSRTSTRTPTPTGTRITPTFTSTPTDQPNPSCAVTYAVQNDWGAGATINVTVRNNGSSAINGWTLAWTFPGNQQLTQVWGGAYTQSGAVAAVSNVSYNANLAANGGTAGFGLNLAYNGSNPPPTRFTLNGIVCGDTGPTNTPTATPTKTNTPTPTATGVTPTFTATPTRTNTLTPTPTPGSGEACVVTYTTNQWNTGFTADVKITNNGTTAIHGWTLTWSFANGQQITSAWNATVTQTGANVSASNPAGHWNGAIGANGGAVSFGFQATHMGTNARPTNFALNGTACTVN